MNRNRIFLTALAATLLALPSCTKEMGYSEELQGEGATLTVSLELDDATKASSSILYADDGEKYINDVTIFVFNNRGIREGISSVSSNSAVSSTDISGVPGLACYRTSSGKLGAGAKFTGLTCGKKEVYVIANFLTCYNATPDSETGRSSSDMTYVESNIDTLANIITKEDFLKRVVPLNGNATSYKKGITGNAGFYMCYGNINPGFFQMGHAEVTVKEPIVIEASDGSVTELGGSTLIALHPVASRVRLKSLSIDNSKKRFNSNGNFVVLGMFLTNALTYCRLDGSIPEAAFEGFTTTNSEADSYWTNKCGYLDDGYYYMHDESSADYDASLGMPSRFSENFLRKKGLSTFLGANSAAFDMISYTRGLVTEVNKTPVHSEIAVGESQTDWLDDDLNAFYCYPNPITIDHFGWSLPFTPRKTRLVLALMDLDTYTIADVQESVSAITTDMLKTFCTQKGIEGKIWYYPVTLPVLEMGTSYDINMTITRYGSTDPDIMQWKVGGNFDLSYEEWSDGGTINVII